MKLLAFDPGLEKTGYAVFLKNHRYQNNYKYLNSGLIKTSSKKSIEKRLFEIYKQVNKIIDRFKPNLIIFEQLFFFKNKKTIISVSQAQGVILLLAGQKGLSVKTLTPLSIKESITGYGLADKKSIKKMIEQQLNIKKKGINDDEYDAIACGLAFCFQNNDLI